MKPAFPASLLLLACQFAPAVPFLVEDGRPRAEIVLGEQPARMQRVAAHIFREDIEKISGARLPIVAAPGGNAVKVFIGRSSQTDEMGLTPHDLRFGAYRIVSGPDWLALLGDDRDFTPKEPFARNNGDIPRAQAEWEELAGGPWGMPHGGLYKNRLRLPGTTGKPAGATGAKDERLEIWGFDERGSFNAVCGFLRRLGARWYLPGELGEVLPSLKTIPLTAIDETVRPDFALRQFNFRFSTAGYDTSLWAMRLGLREDARLQIAHGLARMTSRDEIFTAHPDWFALYGGKRDYRSGYSKNQLCYSNEELFRETVRYARAQLDIYGLESVSIMPPDGYTAICQCEDCRGKDSPERPDRGLLSNHVWEFVNRVAKEIGKDHPAAKVLNCAYGVYTLPPENIDRLEPNVLVCIVGGRRPRANRPEEQEEIRRLREAWAAKTDNPIMIFENYPFTARGWYLPAFTPRCIGDSINATKGMSRGEDIWLSAGRDFATEGIGFNHFQTWFTARMYWGGKAADVNALFEEYCRLFYGPAGDAMRAFFDYCEVNWREMENDKSRADAALGLFEKARSTVAADSVHGRRLALVDDFLQGLRRKRDQLAQKRGPVPKLRLVGDARGIVIDGLLEDEYWRNCPTAATGTLAELQTGRRPTLGTSVKAGWQAGSVCFAIRCDERPGDAPRSAASRHDDAAIWRGDVVEILMATESHSYYQIAVSPDGTVVDLDRGVPKGQWFGWESRVEVATRVADDHWTIELRLPITADENDPLNQVIGRKPTQSLPWHVNICRQRVRDDGVEHSALSPTGTAGFHVPLKFAHFYDGRSHQFEADPEVTDFVLDFRRAGRQRKPTVALAAFLALAEGKVTDLQKSVALEQAAKAAAQTRDFTRAEAIAARIPIVAVRQTARMESLLAQRKFDAAVAEFAAENLAGWPFWQRGDGYFARGRAYAATKDGPAAEADLEAALEWASDPRRQQDIRLAIGRNRETALKDQAGALTAYQAVFGGRSKASGATQFYAVQAAARILVAQGRYTEALSTLALIDTEAMRGTWRYSTLIARGDAHAAAGDREAAHVAWRAVLNDADADKRHRETAATRLQQR